MFFGCSSAPRFYQKTVQKPIKKEQQHQTILDATIQKGDTFIGLASFYGYEFAGRKTASGEVFDPEGLTAAHLTWPFGTIVKVTSLNTNKSVIVKINDRGPFTNCIIDLSYGAAKKIGLLSNAEVKIEILKVGTTSK
ncbi:MAG: septal ring lytic transglycosylase RlpA family protein [bacterium]|nr:septal ring lytic transglycosylase RlpA family protein [bacterium]